MKYLGGYSILDLTDANVSAQANVCYNQDKPVLVYGANGESYFADTITKSGTSIIITKGGKTITIANNNTITNVGDIQLHLYNIRITGTDTDENARLLILNLYLYDDITNMTITEFTNYLHKLYSVEGSGIDVGIFVFDRETDTSLAIYDVSEDYLGLKSTGSGDDVEVTTFTKFEVLKLF